MKTNTLRQNLLIATFCMISVSLNKSFAQTRTLNQVQEVTGTSKEIKELFSKKTSSESDGDQKKQYKNVVFREKKYYSDPGDIIPNAKVLPFDKLGAFDGGAAIVIKGNTYALIDKSGNLIKPFSAARLSYVASGQPIFSGFFYEGEVGESSRSLINAKGKKLGSLQNIIFSITQDGKYAVFGNGKNYKLIDTSGKTIYNFSESFFKGVNPDLFISSLKEEIGIFQQLRPAADGTFRYTYMSIDGSMISKDTYLETEPFSEGLACVGKNDEFGVIRYGFIDKRGKVVIPFIYSNKPGNFHNGRARVVPNKQNEFKCAFINRQGELIIKSELMFGDFYKGYAVYGDILMDTLGKRQKLSEYLISIGLKLGQRDGANVYENVYGQHFPVPDSKFRFVAGSGRNQIGYFDINTKALVKHSFLPYGNTRTLWFDPISKLAYAESFGGKDANGKEIWRKGYINEEGLFVMVIGEPEKW